ncbi:MAG: helix-turn-helix domain-containing protein [Alphaproteobacteria bacterium]|nr:helix-turn-helix domain-containing protein [Alphaproteobacteria bacterium]
MKNDTAKKQPPLKAANTKKLNERWGQDSIKAGWTAIPSVILERQQSLGLNAMDLAIIMHLVKHWWEAERNPYPSKRRICEAMGISESTMRKHVAKLQKAGLVNRAPKYLPGTKGVISNEYDLSGLVKRSKKLAQEALEIRKGRDRTASQLRRKKVEK